MAPKKMGGLGVQGNRPTVPAVAAFLSQKQTPPLPSEPENEQTVQKEILPPRVKAKHELWRLEVKLPMEFKERMEAYVFEHRKEKITYINIVQEALEMYFTERR